MFPIYFHLCVFLGNKKSHERLILKLFLFKRIIFTLSLNFLWICWVYREKVGIFLINRFNIELTFIILKVCISFDNVSVSIVGLLDCRRSVRLESCIDLVGSVGATGCLGVASVIAFIFLSDDSMALNFRSVTGWITDLFR